ncbi:amino acid ABC transporter substrate-binding protein [Anaerovibrio sp. RM50]|uniref:amino acid ABC transporter substrate-binding protein n=1 Tax=Anaerovibrio sp. RM50 TaxID=1200557 RepID=UPI00068716AC|nr:amino acid ABC transporter substrate-binding protein [Anaerovibrio sp. RM50]
MKKILAICMMLVLAMAALAGCGNDTAKKDATQKIVVGLDDNFPPMGFKDEKNEIVGFDIDLAKEASKRLGCDVEFKAIDWNSKEAELKSGRVDVLWNGLDITEKRKENMLFSDPYMNNRQIVFVATNKGVKIASEADLAGKVIGTQSGGTSEEYFEGKKELKSSMKEVKYYPDFINAFMDLENGRIDAVVGDEIIGRYYISKHPEKITAIDTVIGDVSQFGFAFRKDDQALRDKVQKVFDEMIKDGTVAKISEKWFAKDITLKK